MKNIWSSNLEVVLVVVGLVVEDPDAVEAAGDGAVVEVVLTQVRSVIDQPKMGTVR